uniref:BrnA antitoxin of type II toxin-antitoxin system n=1 Tax=Candidatus Kentrum sp. TC TaxID=2126339 RepID=A0A450ZZJ1_9GAMM|nr:MAG: hypothetical protein BECKTC1821E_GA0114239_101620 [Candidatus Kentron sp. TC]VFK42390.1 MAG: hypothetical protein BECKTC1821D_GA0114238_101221 [Candidatus Kentron sp. TC]VFK59193.1 MAG: hypothetical protein BECKTC1821F_GA0114240_103020 [Candidatus Kentron sp. TC]
MNESFSSTISPDRGESHRDEYPKVTQADLDRARFRVGLEPAPREQRITLSLESNLIEYFESKAGEHGHETSIGEILRQAKEREDLQGASTVTRS